MNPPKALHLLVAGTMLGRMQDARGDTVEIIPALFININNVIKS